METLHQIDSQAHGRYVPINVTPCDTVLARTRLHHLGASFVRHLQYSIDTGGLIKGSLAGMLSPTIPVRQEIESYIKMKMYSMQESLATMTSYSDERLAGFLKKALEAPTHVARKMLIYYDLLRGDSKKEVQERYRECMHDDLGKQLDYLLALDAWYSSALQCQLRSPNKTLYADTLTALQADMPKVIEFLRSNILRLDETRL